MKWNIYTNKYYYQQGIYIVDADTEAEAFTKWDTGQFLGTDVVIETSEDYFELEEELFDCCEVMDEPIAVLGVDV